METRLTEGVASLLFVVISAHYSGSLLMVLVTEVSLPFDNIRDGLLAHPRWRVIVESGNIFLFQNVFDLSDPVFRRAHEEASSGRSTMATMEEALQALVADGDHGHFLYGTASYVLSKGRSVYTPGLDLRQFCRPVHSPEALVAAKTSPFRRALDSGMLSLWESGGLDRVEHDWYGRRAPEARKTRPELSFTLAHLLLAFLIFLFGLVSVVLLFAFEAYSSKWGKCSARVLKNLLRMTGEK